jgi:hypothetical protein
MSTHVATLPILTANALVPPGAGAEPPVYPSWGTYATIVGSSFTSGHRFWVMATFKQSGIVGQQNRAKLQFNGADVTGCSNSFSTVNGPFQYQFMMAQVVGTGSGVGLSFLAQGSTTGFEVRDVNLIAIDVDVDNLAFPPQDSSGWLWAENLTPQYNALPPGYPESVGVTLTPDGTSDYMIIGDLELYRDIATSAGYGYAQIKRDGIALIGTGSDWDSGVADNRNHLSMVKFLQAPAAAPTRLSLCSGGGYAVSGWPIVASAKIMVICLNAFSSKAWTQNVTFTPIPATDTVLVSTTPTPAPSIGDTMLAFRMNWANAWQLTGANYVNYRLRETGNITKKEELLESWGSYLSNARSDIFPTVFQVGATTPTYDLCAWTTQDPGTALPNRSVPTIVALSAQVSHVHVPGVITTGASAGITTTASAQPLKDVVCSAELDQPIGFVSLAHVAAIWSAHLQGYIAILTLPSASAVMTKGVRAHSSITVTATANPLIELSLPPTSMTHSFLGGSEIRPAELMELLLGGDLSVHNQLIVVSANQVALDVAHYLHAPYTFDELGVRTGDWVFLMPLDPEAPWGPNANKAARILDPHTMELLGQPLVAPDSSAYKFYIARRGI